MRQLLFWVTGDVSSKHRAQWIGVFSVVFLTDIPRHHCLIPEENLTQDWCDAIIPIEAGSCWQQAREVEVPGKPPAYMSCWLALKYFPRRLSLSELAVALEMLGKLVINNGTSLMYAYTAELYPTVLRNTATGVCITVSRIGSCLAPFLLS
ncbi:hypothetical protein NQZ68_032151 [Dissostichus eleginoides]|nr:hypothetical protein NQZ68_032151 [Dissostichus eleginoides]